MISFSTGKLRKKNPVLDQWEVCFLYQLLRLRKIRGNNSWNKLVKISDEFVIGPVLRPAYKSFLERWNRSLFWDIFLFFQLGYHTLGSANTSVAIWRDTRKWLESFMGNSQWETAPSYTWLSRSFRIFNESMLEQRCKRQANHGWDFDLNYREQD